MEQVNIKEIYNQLIKKWSEPQASLILKAIVDDLIHDKIALKNIIEVAQEFQAMNWFPVFETDFLEEMGIPEEAFIKFVQEQGYKPTLGEEFVLLGKDEEGLEMYAPIYGYVEFFKIQGAIK